MGALCLSQRRYTISAALPPSLNALSKDEQRRHVNVFVFRLNEGKVWTYTMVRADHIARNKVEKRRTCEELTR